MGLGSLGFLGNLLAIFILSRYEALFIGTVSQDGYFFSGQNILISSFCVCADALFASFTVVYLLILKMLTETLLIVPFSMIGRCSLVPTSHWLLGKCARINSSPAAFSIILQNHSRLPVSIFSVKKSLLSGL